MSCNEHVPSNKMNNDGADAHCYSFGWISWFWVFGEPCFFLTGDFSTDFVCLPKQWKNVSVRSLDFCKITIKLYSF